MRFLFPFHKECILSTTWWMLVVGEGLGEDLAMGGADRRVVVATKERPRDGKGRVGQRESEEESMRRSGR